jgi:preprotein translocase subunit YajC
MSGLITSTALLFLAQGSPQATPPGADPLGLMWPLLFVMVFFYFFLYRPQKREADEKRKLMESLKKNDKVLTSAGIYGTIVNLKEDEVTLRVDDQNKVKVRFARSAIARVVGPESSKPTDDSKKS